MAARFGRRIKKRVGLREAAQSNGDGKGRRGDVLDVVNPRFGGLVVVVVGFVVDAVWECACLLRRHTQMV
jgi:hypothetical protein